MALETEGLVAGHARAKGAATPVTQALTLSLRRGDLVCLLGANGIGKSTLLRTLSAMQPPLSGQVRIGGADAHRMRAAELAKRLAVVLTDRVSVSGLSAYALAALGRYPHTSWGGQLDADDHRIIREAFESVRARHLADRQVDELSDGERQKVMIARALAQETPVLILDEITAFLDLPRRIEAMSLLRELAHRHGKAILVSTHDLELALRAADVLWVLSSGGRLDVGTPEELVLDGSLGRAFQSEGLAFDPMTGTFSTPGQRTRRIRLTGDGLAARWTAHALERCGYHVDPHDASAQLRHGVEVVADGEGWRWIATIDGRPTAHSSLAAVTHLFREHASKG